MTKMEDQIRTVAKQFLDENKISEVIGYEKTRYGKVRPVVINKVEDADRLVWNEECNLNLVTYFHHRKLPPGKDQTTQKTAVVVRPCDVRAVNLLISEQQIKRENIKIIGIEPASRQHKLSGIKKISDLPDEFKPKILDYSLIDDIIAVEDRDAFEAGINIARTEGIMVGPTTGALLHAAKITGADAKGRAVVISPDNATKYVSAYAEYLQDD